MWLTIQSYYELLPLVYMWREMVTRSTWWWRTTKQTRVIYLASAHIKRDKIFVSELTTNVRDDAVCATTVRVPRSKDTRRNRWLQHEFILLQPRTIQMRLPWTRACQATILESLVPRKTYNEQQMCDPLSLWNVMESYMWTDCGDHAPSAWNWAKPLNFTNSFKASCRDLGLLICWKPHFFR